MEDLRYLEDLVSRQDISDADLRRSSTVLRLLLVDNGGLIERVAKRISLRPKVMAPINEKTAEQAVHHRMAYLCLSVNAGILDYGPFHAHTSRPPPTPPEENDCMLRQEISVGNFKRQTCAAFGGERIDRETLVKYVANKIGGAHYDTSHNKNRAKLRRKYIALDGFHSKGILTFEFGPFTGIYLELYATAKHLIESPDIQNLVSVISGDN